MIKGICEYGQCRLSDIKWSRWAVGYGWTCMPNISVIIVLVDHDQSMPSSTHLTKIDIITFITNATKYTKGCRGWISMFNIDFLTYVVKMNRVNWLIKPAKSTMDTADEKKLSIHATWYTWSRWAMCYGWTCMPTTSVTIALVDHDQSMPPSAHVTKIDIITFMRNHDQCYQVYQRI